MGDRREFIGDVLDAVAVGHPDLMIAAIEALEERVAFVDHERRGAILAGMSAGAMRSEMLRDDVHAVADAEHRAAQVQDFIGDIGRAAVVEARGPARENDAARIHRADFLRREVIRMDFAIDPRLAHAPRDELGILAAEIENQDHEVTLP